MKKSYFPVLVGGQRPVIRVVAVRGDQNVFRRCRVSYGYHDGRMLELLPFKGELDQISRQQVFQLTGLCQRPDGKIVPGQEIVQVRDARPGPSG